MLFLFLGAFGGFWLVWPGVLTNHGWMCANDIVTNSKKKPSDAKSLLENIERKLKIGSAVSAQTLLKVENLGPIEKLRIVGDACFR